MYMFGYFVEGPAIIRSANPLRQNAWTNIVAERNLQDGSLSINEEIAVKGRSKVKDPAGVKGPGWGQRSSWGQRS